MICTPSLKSVCSTLSGSNSWALWSLPLASPWTLPRPMHVSIWPTPTNLKAVQAFLGFSNFYRRFIVGFSNIFIPLIRLTCKDTSFSWGPDHTKAFGALKHAFTMAPILVHFNPDNPIVVETDTSYYVVAAIISQISPDAGDIHPITFYSHSMQPAELNYEIYDKELLAIFKAFQ